MIINVAYIVMMALLNRARGSHLFEHTDSTVLSRLVSTLVMALLTTFAFDKSLLTFSILWPCLALWCWFAWDKYWAAAIGDPIDLNKPAFLPVDAIMRLLWPSPSFGIQLRLWGLVAMTLRQQLIWLAIILLTVLSGHIDHIAYGAFALLLGLPYFIAGYFTENKAVMIGEFSVGAIIGSIFIMIIG